VTVFHNPKQKEGDQGSSEKGKEKGKEKSTEKILRLIAENSTITTRELADAVKLSLAGVEKAIRTLKKQGRLSRIGPDKGGHWEIST
jgi:ATP-dependent DNA helicase RecG